jgi:hypothetical protein
MDRARPAESTREAELEARCESLSARLSRLQDLLKNKTEVVERKQEVIDKLRDTSAKKTEAIAAARLRYQTLRDRVSAIEADKGKLEQTYYDQYFAKLAQAERLEHALNQVKDDVASGEGARRAVELLEQLVADAELRIPSLRPYLRLTVDLGIGEGCTDFCHQHRRNLVARMPTAFNTRVMAILDLAEYENAEAYIDAVRAASKGNVIREARKAEAAGLTCHLFEPAEYADDIQAILDSKPERQGGALRPPYDQGAEAFLEFIREEHANREPPCPRHHNSWYGIFGAGPGSRETLLGFIMLERNGQFGHYRHILGHGDWLAKGIMFELHFALVDLMYSSEPGLSVVSYAGWTDLPDRVDARPGLTRWKKKTLFKPRLLLEVLSSPRERIISEIIENSANKAFPEHVLDGARSGACLFCAALMGQRDVIHFHRRGIDAVTLVDHDGDMMAELQKAYPESWTYLTGDAFDFIDSASAEGREFDVVTLDPWVYLQQRTIGHLRQLISLANNHVVISLTDTHFFRRNHVAPTADAVFRYFNSLDPRVRAAEVLLSTPHAGGLYWCVLDVQGA